MLRQCAAPDLLTPSLRIRRRFLKRYDLNIGSRSECCTHRSCSSSPPLTLLPSAAPGAPSPPLLPLLLLLLSPLPLLRDSSESDCDRGIDVVEEQHKVTEVVEEQGGDGSCCASCRHLLVFSSSSNSVMTICETHTIACN